ncbi:hypothetical protein FRC12_006343 [Ceratobasidium sp. 428]|nr:hypothetical protein FRC12_006343 [Ceratobasidium sp. 428]
MKLHKTLSYCFRKDECNEFVGSSLTSSRLMSEHLHAWVGSSDRGRLFAIKFHSEWMHDGCPVIKWYIQQLESSTKFQSIEHRRNLDAPFYHEFLLLKLTDGAVCKLERIGDGSRADAVRHIGCTAYDLIQWFSVADYESSSIELTSERIADVSLGREFDILDVLAVCHSIQNTKACRTYTLQRYNCYFLCLTVLAVLTRRVASWETKVKVNEWDSSLTSMYARWSNLSSDQAYQYAILVICAYLEPDNPRRAQFIFDVLREHLGSQSQGFAQCHEAMRQALWRADWEFVFRVGLTESLSAIPDLFKDAGYCSQQLKRAVATSREDSELAIMSCKTLLAKKYLKIMAEEHAKKLTRTFKLCINLRRLWHIEHPVPFGKLALSRMFGLLASPIVLFTTPRLYADSSYDRKVFTHISLRVMLLKQGPGLFTCMALDALEQSYAMKTLWYKAIATVSDDDVGQSGMVRILDRLAFTGVLPPLEVSLLLANWLNRDNLAALIASLAAPDLSNMLFALEQSRQTEVRLILQGKPESTHTSMTIDKFQEIYIKNRIAAHARRVAVHQLAAEQFVVEDIKEAMRDVWKGLPSGFGASRHHA